MAQQTAPPVAPTPPPVPHVSVSAPEAPAIAPPQATFSLDFPGGSLRDFVTAVEQASGKPFNLVTSDNSDSVRVPPLSVKEVTLSPLLNALSANRETITMAMPGGVNGAAVQYHDTGYSFVPMPPAERAGHTVWHFRVQNAPSIPETPAGPKPVHFYQLRDVLERGNKLEDITTVAQTAWKMMNLPPEEIPQMKFHEETGILMATGSEFAVGVIANILTCLPQKTLPPASGGSAKGVPVPAGTR